MVSKATIFAVVCLIASIAMIVHAAAPQAHELTPDYSYEQYLKDFPQRPESATLTAGSLEYNKRAQLFQNNLASILKHNSEDHSWKQGVNAFTDMSTEEFLALYTGNVMGPEHTTPLQEKTSKIQMNKLTGSLADDALIASRQFPESIDWSARNMMVKEVRSQGRCGSCYAHSALATLEFYLKALAGKSISLGPQQAVDCFENPRHCGGSGGCHGYAASFVFSDFAKNVGIVREEDYPYFSGTTQDKGECNTSVKPVVKTSGARRITPNNVTAVMEALTEGVVAVSVDATHWKAYESGILMNSTRAFVDEYNTYEVTLNHAVVLVGMGKDTNGMGFWKVRNSWGESWGLKGHIHLYRPTNGVPEDVYIDMDPFSGSACEGDDPSPFYVAGNSGILSNAWVPTGVTMV